MKIARIVLFKKKKKKDTIFIFWLYVKILIWLNLINKVGISYIVTYFVTCLIIHTEYLNQKLNFFVKTAGHLFFFASHSNKLRSVTTKSNYLNFNPQPLDFPCKWN